MFQLKDSIGVERIEKIESEYLSRALKSWEKNPNLLLLGYQAKNYTNDRKERIPIISFVIQPHDDILFEESKENMSMLLQWVGVFLSDSSSCCVPC